MPEIRANTVLPARRRPVALTTADGLRLVGELASPVDGPPRASLVCLHPLPTHGGMMDSHLLRKAAWRLPALAGVAVLRFNTRGTASARGRSDGAFDGGNGERLDLAAALDLVEFDGLPPPWLLGWSFGADLAVKYGTDPSVVGAVLLAPSLRLVSDEELAGWARSGRPLVAVLAERDEYTPPAQLRARLAAVPQTRVVQLAGARHLFVGHADRVLDEVAGAVAPWAQPLPRHWEEGKP